MKNNGYHPPKFAEAFLSWFCKEELLEDIQGDLREVFEEELTTLKPAKARLYYVLRVLSFFKPGNIGIIKPTNKIMLFKNYLLIAYRHLLKNKSYSLFNLAGLTIGLTASLLMITYVLDEMSFDKQFSRHEDIYRIAQHVDMENDEMTGAVTPYPLGATLKKEFPEVEEFTSFTLYNRLTINVGDEKFTDPNAHLVSSSFLELFDYPLLAGDPATVLKAPNSLVISKSKAISYFGGLDIVGKAVEVDHHGTFTITGIMKDPYKNSHFHHPMLFHISDDYFNGNNWNENEVYTYILLKQGTDPRHVVEKLPEFYEKYMSKPVIESFSGSGYLFLQKLTDIHLFSDLSFELEPNNNFYHVLGMGVLALFIVLVVCINYMNMATAQATRRIREVGIRKVLGSNRQMLLFQFVTESGLLTFLSAVLALVLIPVFLPYFNYLAEKSFIFTDFTKINIILCYFLIVLLTGLIGGSYPAIFLSGFHAGEVLRKSYSFGRFKLPVNKLLNAFQFAVALVMIIVTLTVYRQVEFAKAKDLGFDQENVLKIDLKNRTNDEYPLVQELLAHPDIERVAAAKQAPGENIQLEGFPFELPDGSFGVHKAEFNAVDENFLPALDIKLVAGRNFSNESPGSLAIINETLAKKLGYLKPEEALEKKMKLPLGEDFYARIVGVVQDTHMRSLHHEVSSHVLINFTPITTLLLVKTKGTNMRNLLGYVEDKTAELTNSSSHAVSFLDQDYWKQYQAEERRTEILSIFSLLVVFLALAGLIGLVSFYIRFKSKEINIRKVFGAGFLNVLMIYVRQLIGPVLISVALAIPVALFFVDQWLNNFAYRIAQPYDLLIGSSLFLMLVILLVVIFQCRRSFMVNPTAYLKED